MAVTHDKISALLAELRTWEPGELKSTLVQLGERFGLEVFVVDRVAKSEGLRLKVGDELGGHIVSGHVDGVARIVGLKDEGESTRALFEAPEALARFIAPKGSVCLNGTSLTVNEVDGRRFGVNFIPHTKEVTTWGDAAEGDDVNLEIDTLARYVARLAETAG